MAKKLVLLLAAYLAGASALVMSPAAHALAPQHVAASPTMACNGGKGGKGGKTPPKDKTVFRPKLNELIQKVRPPVLRSHGQLAPVARSICVPYPAARLCQSDSAENVKEILLSASTEKMLLKMNWKYRRSAGHQVRKRAAQVCHRLLAAPIY